MASEPIESATTCDVYKTTEGVYRVKGAVFYSDGSKRHFERDATAIEAQAFHSLEISAQRRKPLTLVEEKILRFVLEAKIREHVLATRLEIERRKDEKHDADDLPDAWAVVDSAIDSLKWMKVLELESDPFSEKSHL